MPDDEPPPPNIPSPGPVSSPSHPATVSSPHLNPPTPTTSPVPAPDSSSEHPPPLSGDYLAPPPRTSSAVQLQIHPALPKSTSTPNFPSAPPSPQDDSSRSPSVSRSPHWFGASHYDQVDASFAGDNADIPPTAVELKEEDIFLVPKHRLGKAIYLVAPSEQSQEPTFHQPQPLQRPHDQAASIQREDGGHTDPGDGGEAGKTSGTVKLDRGQSLTQRRPSSSQPNGVQPADGAVSAAGVANHAKLGQWPSTAICANDITSSCFYAISITVQAGGIWAPLCFLIVVFVLWLFRSIYGEAVTALPLNGGAYNILLNTTSKKIAAFAGCLSLLSYMATSVVSAASAIDYLQYMAPSVPLSVGVVVLLALFAALTLWGIKDSSTVAYAILVCHMSTIAVLAVTMIVFLCRHPSEQQFSANVHSDVNPSVGYALLYGYASAMLGVTGFETSANFVEEQRDGVFVKTLRNMWVMVSIINPSLALLTVCILPLDVIVSSSNQNILLAFIGDYTGGAWLKYWVAVDAFLVLAAAVLTAYVGMNGLARRLALDRGLPHLLLQTNRWRGTNHWIILAFLVICITLYFIVNGDVNSLGNVYAISFLLVMAGFAIGNGLLKYNRGQLKREVRASWITVMAGLALVLLALGGVIGKDPSILAVWIVYFLVVLSAVGVMFFRVHLLHVTYYAVQHVSGRVGRPDNGVLKWIRAAEARWSRSSTVFFTKYGRLSVINEAILYLLHNEEATHLYITHVYHDEAQIPPKLLRHVSILDQEYPGLTVELVLVKGQFDGATVHWLSEKLSVPINMMFCTCPKQDFKLKLASLGGVRLVTR